MRRRSSALVATLVVLGHGVPAAGGAPSGAPAPPEAPSSVTAAAGERRATVSWVPPAGGDAVTGYVVAQWPSGPQHAAPGGTTRLVVGDLAPGGHYRFTVAATDGTGAGPPSEPTPEVALPADTRFTGGPAARSVVPRPRARFIWASDPGALPAACSLDRQPVGCADGVLRVRGLGPGTHAVTARARDPEGGPDPTPAQRFWTVPRDDRHLEVGPAWRRDRQRGAYRGTVLRTTRRGAFLTSPGVDVRALSLVVSVGPRAGTVAAFLGNRRLGRFDLAARVRRAREVVPLARFNGVHNGRIRIVVRSRGKPVVVDGLAVETWFAVPTRAD